MIALILESKVHGFFYALGFIFFLSLVFSKKP